MAQEYHYTWTWDLASTPEALWPLVSDTNRFNRDTGLPPMQMLGIQNGVKRVKFKFPVRVEWEEEPFEWTYPYRFGILRRYRTGPAGGNAGGLPPRTASTLRHAPDVSSTGQTPPPVGRPRHCVWDWDIQPETIWRSVSTVRPHRLTRGPAAGRCDGKKSHRERTRPLQTLSDRLRADGADGKTLDRLYEYLHRADDLSIQRMRPYALADGWGLPRRTVLETFLKATRAGMLDMYWDLLCPECRGVAKDHAHLSELSGRSHCSTCEIDFHVNLDHNVEVIFRPNPSVRAVDAAVEFCVGSPQKQPHIVFSLVVPPREELPISTMLQEGRYRLRASGLEGTQNLVATKDGPAQKDFHADALGWSTDIQPIGLSPYIRLLNRTDFTQTFKLERTAWSDQAATAADVTTLQVFRDLFSSEVLRPEEEISVGSTALMFTDLRNSTKLYREIGDAPAFGRVREHFEILERSIAAEGGAIIKTMGDSIMGAFRKPVSALRAIWSVQKELAARGVPPLLIKVGIHHGPCIAVNLNDRLDYFGSTVNIAARLPGFSSGGEAIFTESIRNDPEVLEFLERNAAPNSLTRFQGELRGYDKPMELWRVKV
ncbi:MAG: adenylate/guanylate cyclase domain-containing protein [Chloroflexi bacterium]|nr:adenylate/guanylate cyclase domain-containing protein [Chloroflexota bacterium]